MFGSEKGGILAHVVRISAFLVLLAAPSALLGADPEKSPDRLPKFFFLGSDSESGVMSMQCQGKPPYERITCEFTQLGVRKGDEASFKKSEATLAASLEAESEADLRKEVETLRSNAALMRDRAKTLSVPEKRAWYTRYLQYVDAVSRCRDKACIVSEMLRHNQEDRDTCTVWGHHFSAEFDRVGPDKWISNPGPQGLCNVVTVQTLEREPNEPLLWTFTSSRVTADKDKPCDELKPTRSVYSWKTPSALAMQCNTINFGL